MIILIYFIIFTLMYFVRKTGGNPDDNLIKDKKTKKTD